MSFNLLRKLTTCALLLSLAVVMLGAYTRLTNAGLGCPDWPGCYGKLVLPSGQNARLQAQALYPETTIETRKAWTEMTHRYAAGTLALIILVLGLNTFIHRREQRILSSIPFILLGLVLFQALLGMWTVTLKLLPLVVMAHLLGGISIFCCLCYFRMQLTARQPSFNKSLSPWVKIGIVLVFLQIALGGWVSANYAGISCVGFPRCNGLWLPHFYFSKGFNLFSAVGINYQGGVLDNAVRMTIQFIHRLGAFVVLSYVVFLSCRILLGKLDRVVKRMALLALIFVSIQFALGIINVVFLLPLWASVAHNGVAAGLLATLFALNYLITGGVRNAHEPILS